MFIYRQCSTVTETKLSVYFLCLYIFSIQSKYDKNSIAIQSVYNWYTVSIE